MIRRNQSVAMPPLRIQITGLPERMQADLKLFIGYYDEAKAVEIQDTAAQPRGCAIQILANCRPSEESDGCVIFLVYDDLAQCFDCILPLIGKNCLLIPIASDQVTSPAILCLLLPILKQHCSVEDYIRKAQAQSCNIAEMHFGHSCVSPLEAIQKAVNISWKGLSRETITGSVFVFSGIKLAHKQLNASVFQCVGAAFPKAPGTLNACNILYYPERPCNLKPFRTFECCAVVTGPRIADFLAAVGQRLIAVGREKDIERLVAVLHEFQDR